MECSRLPLVLPSGCSFSSYLLARNLGFVRGTGKSGVARKSRLHLFFLGNSYSFTQPILAEAALWVDLLHFRNADQDYIGYYKVSYWRVSL